jgi:sec-independent protein translocase protein TatA
LAYFTEIIQKPHRCGFFVAIFPIFAKSLTKTFNIMHLLTIGTTEIIIILILVLLLFGGRKIPELMKGLGKGVKNFKDGMNGVDDVDELNEKKNSEKANKE